MSDGRHGEQYAHRPACSFGAAHATAEHKAIGSR
jgi:hypothetical protein